MRIIKEIWEIIKDVKKVFTFEWIDEEMDRMYLEVSNLEEAETLYNCLSDNLQEREWRGYPGDTMSQNFKKIKILERYLKDIAKYMIHKIEKEKGKSGRDRMYP